LFEPEPAQPVGNVHRAPRVCLPQPSLSDSDTHGEADQPLGLILIR
jgi:hypothetical protein